MFAIEARKMGYRVHTFSPDSDTPTGQVADIETVAEYGNIDAVKEFARAVDVVTFEFENVPSATIDAAAEFVAVYPNGGTLHITQNRLREKTFLEKNGYPIARFKQIKLIDDLYRGWDAIGAPCVLKTAGFGYDGKGQSTIYAVGEIESAFSKLNGQDAVLEQFVEFEKEVSVVCARGQDGDFVHYGVIENSHARHILDISFAPAIVSEVTFLAAIDMARSIAEALGYVGTLCIEFFVTGNGQLLVNELAPRPHNSGHVTFGPCVTSQFEQQLRAVCGLELGSTAFYRPAAMANLLGDLWENGEPDWAAALSSADVKLHLYGKSEPRSGRKMGHLTAMAACGEEAVRCVEKARSAL